MAMCTGSFPPSQTLVKYLASFLYAASINSNEIGKWAKYSLERLDHTMRKGRRKFIPTEAEINSVLIRKPLTINVYYLDGTSRKLQIESQTRVDETLGCLAETLKLTNPEVYGLYDMEEVSAGFIQDFFS
eukprot:UN25432